MTQALELGGTEKVLEIGTGSGYQTAILAELARWVVSGVLTLFIFSDKLPLRLRVLLQALKASQ